MVLAIFGPSASGKTTVGEILTQRGWTQIVPYTTRPMRDGEREGREYHFISEDEMSSLYNEGKLMEMKMYPTVKGYWYYGTAVADYENSVSDRKFVILGAHGITLLKDKVKNLCEIRLEVSEDTRRSRLTQRKDDPAEAERRLQADAYDFAIAEAAEALYNAREQKPEEWEFSKKILEPWLVYSTIAATNLSPEEVATSIEEDAEQYMTSVIETMAEDMATDWVADIDQDFEVELCYPDADITVPVSIFESRLEDNIIDTLVDDICQKLLDGEDVTSPEVKANMTRSAMQSVAECYADHLEERAMELLAERDEALREEAEELNWECSQYDD